MLIALVDDLASGSRPLVVADTVGNISARLLAQPGLTDAAVHALDILARIVLLGDRHGAGRA